MTRNLAIPADDSILTANVYKNPIAEIQTGKSPRLSGVVNAHVTLLAGCEEELPPIVVHRQTMHIIDGNHRLRAAMRNGCKTIAVTFFEGTDQEAFLCSVELNVKHGLPLTLSDRKAAARRILLDSAGLSDRTIAAKVGLSNKTVAAVRRRLGAESPLAKTRLGRDGRTYPVDDVEGRQRAASLLAARPDASLREIASVASVSPGVVSDVRKRLDAGEAPLSRRNDQSRKSADSASRIGAATKRTPQSLPAGQGNRPGDKQKVLSQLRSDPSVRGTEAGRELIRWLSGHAIHLEDLPVYVNTIPPHQAAAVAALARRSASAWLEVVQRLEGVVGAEPADSVSSTPR